MNDGLGAALTIPKGVLSDIAEAQKKIEAMQKDSIDLAKNFTQFAKDASAIKSSLDNVKVTLDTSQAEQKIKNLLNMINSLGSVNVNAGPSGGPFIDYTNALNDITDKLKEIKGLNEQIVNVASNSGGINSNKISGQLEKIRRGFDSCSGAASTLERLIHSVFGDISLAGFIGQLVKVRGEFEMAERSLSVILKSEQKMLDVVENIKQVSVESPYSASQLVKYTKQLAAFRIEADKLTDTTKMLGDIAAGTGVDVGRLVLAYGQVKSAEFLKGTELRQFSEAGVNMLGGLADRFSEIYKRTVSVGEVMSMVSKRMVKFSDVEAVLKEAVSAGGVFYNMQAQQADTIQGMVVNLKDRVALAFNDLGETYEGFIKKVIGGIEMLIEKLHAVQNVILPIVGGRLLSGIAGRIGGVISTVKKGMGSIATSANFLQKAVGGTIAVVKTFGAALGGWPFVVGAIGTAIVQIISKANKLKNELKDISATYSSTSSEMISRYNDLMDVARGYVTIKDQETDTEKKIVFSEKERLNALENLKAEYGNIIDLSDVELSNIEKINSARQQQIELIKLQAAEEAKRKAYTKAIAEIEGGKIGQLRNSDLRSGIKRFADAAKGYVPGLLDISEEEILATIDKINNMLMDGLFSSEDAVRDKEIRDEFMKTLLTRSGATAEQISKVFDNVVGDTYLLREFAMAFNEVEDILEDLSDFKVGLGIDLEVARSAEEYRKQIQGIADVYAKFEDSELNAKDRDRYKQNPAAKKLDIQKELNKEFERVRNLINDKSLGGISEELQKRLLSELESAFHSNAIGNNVEIWVLELANQVNEEFSRLEKPMGGSTFSLSDGEDIDKLVERLKDRLADLEKQSTKLLKGNKGEKMSILNIWGEDALARIMEEEDAIKRMLGLLDSALNLSDKAAKTASINTKQLQQNTKDLASDIIQLTDGWWKLSEAEKEYNRQNIGSRIHDIGLNILPPEDYNIEQVRKWLYDVIKDLPQEMQMKLRIEVDKMEIMQKEDLSNTISDVVSGMIDYYKKTAEDKLPKEVGDLILSTIKSRIAGLNQNPNVAEALSMPNKVTLDSIIAFVKANEALFTESDFQDILLKLTEKKANDAASAEKKYKSDLNDFLQTLKKSRKEMDALTEEEDEMYIKMLQIKGARVGIKVADDFKPTVDVINDLINTYLPRLDKDMQLQLRLAFSKEDTKDAVESLKDEVSNLWDKLDFAKKMQGWGINMTGYDAEDIYRQLAAKEEEFRKIGTEAAIAEADKIKKERLKIARSEQEEAAKVIYESQKKASLKVEQAYKKMYEDIATIQKGAKAEGAEVPLSSDDIKAGIQGVIDTARKEIDKSQWEIYKESEQYLAAFGDLSNMSSEMLKALKEDLEAFAKTDLNPSDKKAIAGQIEKLNDALVKNEKLKGVWDVISYGFKKIKEGYEELDKLPGLEEEFFKLRDIANAKEAETEAALDAYANALLEGDPAKISEAQERLSSASAEAAEAALKASEAQGAYNDKLESSTAAINNSTEALKGQIEAYTEVGNTISDIFKSTEDIVSAFGGEVGDSTKALFDGFSEGYAVIANLLSITMNATKAFKAIKEAIKGASTALSTLTIIGVVIAAVVAAIKIFDTIQAKKIEANAKAVKNLQKTYEDLDKAIEKALKISESEGYFSRMTANLARQKEMIEESIALQSTRKQTDKVREETEQLMEDLDAVSEKLEELRSKRHELLGAPSDYVSEAESWASSWLSSIGEVGGGLESLRKDFDSFFDNLIIAQLRSEVFGDVFDTLKKMTDDILKDGLITSEEAEALKRFRETNLKLVNEQGKAYLEALGVSSSGAQMENTVSKNISNITATQATAIEALLNSERHYIQDTNTRVASIEAALVGEGENTIVAHLRMQTQYLRTLSTIASAVYYPGKHGKGPGALKVITD